MRLLDWMATRPFADLTEADPSLLRLAERLVVDAHRHWYESSGGTDWSEPLAYHWLRYEDPDPVSRLAAGVRRMSGNFKADETALAELEQLRARDA